MERSSLCHPAGRQRHYREAGLSLLEVIVAAGLLGIGLLPLAYVQSTGVRSGVASYGMLAASALAVQLADRARSIPYTDTRLADTSARYVAPDSTLTNSNPLAGDGTTLTCPQSTTNCGYTRTWQITNNTPIQNAKRIDIQVVWSEYGSSRTYVLSTIKAVGS